MAKAANTSPAIHNIGLCGLTGVIFAVLTSALVLYLEGFVTTSWSVDGDKHTGLWQTCTSEGRPESSEWLISVQVLTSLGLVGIIVAFGLSVIYMSANRASKNVTLVSLAALSFIAGLLMVVSVTVYGVHADQTSRLSWSYFITMVAAILSVLAGILTVVQIRRSNVRL